MPVTYTKYASDVNKEKLKFRAGDNVRNFKYKNIISKVYNLKQTYKVFAVKEVKHSFDQFH